MLFRSGDAATPQGQGQALKVGVATWLGMLAGIAIKLALVFAMIGAFAIAYFA